MYYSSYIKSNKDLIAYLVKSNVLKNKRAVTAMMKVDRKNYCKNKKDPYKDCPQPIGHGATISAPHIHALYIEILSNHLKPGMRVLDVGSGSGYMTAVMAHMVKPSGKVVGVDHINELLSFSKENIRNDSNSLLDENIIEFYETDGRKGIEKFAPYNAIHVGAAAEGIPKELLKQLSIGGRMLIPVANKNESTQQILLQIDKNGKEKFDYIDLGEVNFVPLGNKEDFYY